MRIAIVSDVFPPKSGGSGWSSFFLARSLVQRGHTVQVIVPKEGQTFGETQREYAGLPITEFIYPAAHIPFVRNYTRNERLYPRFAAWLTDFFRRHAIEVAHAQHYLTIPPTVMAAQRTGAVSLATVRDYWPVCYWTTHLSGQQVCPGCSPLNYVKCLYNNQKPVGALAAPVAFYMAANLRLKQRWLAQADAVLAVSSYIQQKLTPFLPAERLHIMPNFIDIADIDRVSDQAPTTLDTDQPFLLYAGKLEENKGARLLIEILRLAAPQLPTLIAGEGVLRSEIENSVREHNLNVRLLDWVEHDELLRLMARAELLLFPSLWPEPLSRVLLEAGAVGALICAINTGGTADIIQDNVNGLLADSATGMAAKLQQILAPDQAEIRARLRAALRQTVVEKFSQPIVVARTEALYQQLIEQKKKVVV